MLPSHKVDQGIRGSAAVVLVWSEQAAQSEWVERNVLVAQRLQKRIVPVVIDGTDVPITLVSIVPIPSTSPCVNAAEEILLQLPTPTADDLLNTLLLQSSHEYIRVRKEAIQGVAELLQRGENRETILAMLEDITRHDLMQGVREMAQGVLDAEAERQQPSVRSSAESRHIFGARCPKGHVTYFDKRAVCADVVINVRNVIKRGDAELDELFLECSECRAKIAPRVDCEGYR